MLFFASYSKYHFPKGLSTLLCLTLVGLISCTKPENTVAILSAKDLIARGQTIYMSNCIACHNVDPRKDGSVGPAISGSSLELVQARVTKATYPAGYKPKRDSHLMQALPQLEKEVSALYSYLNSAP